MVVEVQSEWEKRVKECLDSTTIASLATSDEVGVWAANVYFSYDEKFNIYFISSASTRHMKAIKSNPKVALAIFKPQSAIDAYQIGLQIEGTAAIVPDNDIEGVYATRSKKLARNGTELPKPNEGHFIKEHGGVFIKVIPSSMSYVNTLLFGGNSAKVPLGELVKDGK